MQITDLLIRDDHDLANALTGGQGLASPPIPPVASVPAIVSFDVEWSREISRANVENNTLDFSGLFIQTIATINWSVRQAGLEFVSEPPNPARNSYSVIGEERNGAFF